MRKKFSIEGMSKRGIEVLPDVLDDMGYAGRYIIEPLWFTLSIDSTSPIVQMAIQEAENRVHDTNGRMIIVRKTSYSQVWVSDEEAKTEEEARNIALSRVDDGYSMGDEPEYSTKTPGANNWIYQ